MRITRLLVDCCRPSSVAIRLAAVMKRLPYILRGLFSMCAIGLLVAGTICLVEGNLECATLSLPMGVGIALLYLGRAPPLPELPGRRLSPRAMIGMAFMGVSAITGLWVMFSRLVPL